jgi:hypothetical protein
MSMDVDITMSLQPMTQEQYKITSSHRETSAEAWLGTATECEVFCLMRKFAPWVYLREVRALIWLPMGCPWAVPYLFTTTFFLKTQRASWLDQWLPTGCFSFGVLGLFWGCSL